jgi:hypothetical protein
MTLFISLVFYALSVIPLISLFQIKQLPRYLCAFFITYIAEIILTGNILGLFHQLNNKGLWISLQVFLMVVGWGLWLYFKRPGLFPPRFHKINIHDLPILQKITLIVLGISVIIGYGILVYLILVVPPNNNDSMLVHLVRVGYWLDHGSFTPWDSLIVRQVIYPYNAQIVILWTILFHGTDLFAGFLQYFSVLFTALGIYCIGREIGGNRFQAIIPAFFYLTFPQVIFQATTTQDDLAITCFLILGSYFFLRWYGKEYTGKGDLFYAAISLMIAVGIKPTAFYYFIGFAVFIIVLICFKKMLWKHFFQLAICCFMAFMVLSSYAYINNSVYYHNPLGPSDFVKSESGAFDGNVLTKAEVNSGRFLYQFFSLDGLPIPLARSLQELKAALASKIPSFFNSTSEFVKDPEKTFNPSVMPGTNEDLSWFGPASFLLLIPAFLLGVIKAIKKKDLRIVFLLVVPVFLFLGISNLRPGWDPYQGRYFNPGIAITMPLIIFLLDPKIGKQIYIFAVSIIAIMIAFSSFFLNESKPLITQTTIYRNLSSTSCDESLLKKINCYLSSKLPGLLLDRESILSLNPLQRETYSSPGQYPIISTFSNEIPKNSRIALSLLTGDWEYPFFGRNFEYQLFPVVKKQLLNDKLWLEQNQIDYIIIHADQDQPTMIDPDFVLQDKIFDSQSDNYWEIYRK